MLQKLIRQLEDHAALRDDAVVDAVSSLVDEGVSAEAKAAFLIALADKGETIDEITAFARELRSRSVRPQLDPATRARDILDVCGTGGDRLNTFNISTTVALICAAAGVTVAKHGNRSVTSQCGSADVLEALGIRIDLSPPEAAASLRDRGFAFFFAPNYHPAFKHIGPARKLCAEKGRRTIFNYLGPLLNPAQPSCQLVGVPRPELCQPIARVLQKLGLRRGMAVCGAVPRNGGDHANDGVAPNAELAGHLDELSTLGPNTVAEFYQNAAFAESVTLPSDFGLSRAELSDLKGGDRMANAQIIVALLSGRERGPKREAVLLNTGAALFVADRAKTWTNGIQLAGDIIDSGGALVKLEELRKR